VASAPVGSSVGSRVGNQALGRPPVGNPALAKPVLANPALGIEAQGFCLIPQR